MQNPSGYNGHNVLTSAESEKMAQWLRDDVAAGRLKQADADTAFEQLGIPVEQRASQPDQRSAEHQQLDQHLPAAKAEEYVLQYFRPGQEPAMDAAQKQQLRAFDSSARPG
jgi:hypothetical protein